MFKDRLYITDEEIDRNLVDLNKEDGENKLLGSTLRDSDDFIQSDKIFGSKYYTLMSQSSLVLIISKPASSIKRN